MLPEPHIRKLVFIALMPYFGFSQINSLNNSNGFKNYIFGTSPDAYKNLTLELHEGNTKLYSLHTSSINIDGFDMEFLRLTFYKNKLSVISFQTKQHSAKKMLAHLKATYGEAKQKDEIRHRQTWYGNKLHLVYEENSRTHDALVSFYNDAVY